MDNQDSLQLSLSPWCLTMPAYYYFGTTNDKEIKLCIAKQIRCNS